MIGTGKFMGSTLNLTIWVVIDITCWLDKLIPARGITDAKQKRRKTVKDIIDKEFTIDFCQFFDIVVDVSQVTNSYLFGSKFLQHQENYMVDRFIQNLEEVSCIPHTESRRNIKEDSLFDFRALKCQCRNATRSYTQTESELLRRNGYKLSIGETFIQYYYLCQRKLH